MKTQRVIGIRRAVGSRIFAHNFAAEFNLNLIATQTHRNLANSTYRMFPNMPRPKYSVSPRTKKDVDLIKVNPNLKVVDDMIKLIC